MLAAVALASLMSAGLARAGTITLTTTADAALVDGRLEVRLSVTNRGDEAASSLRPVLRFAELAVAGEAHPLLEPGRSAASDLALTLERIGPGRWPFRIEISYHDERGTTRHALHVGTFLVGTEPVDELELEIVEAPALARSGELRVGVRNLSDGPRTATLTVYVPVGVEARAGPALRLRPGEERIVALELVNRTASAGSRLAAFLTLGYESGGVHRSRVEAVTIRILEPPAEETPARRAQWQTAAGVLILIWLVAVVRQRLRRRPRPSPAGPEAARGAASIAGGRPWRALADLAAVGVSIGFVASYFPPALMLGVTTTSGGDTASHFYTITYLRDVLLPQGRLLGWCPGNYAGFPFLQFYFPLPFLLMAALSSVVPLEVAFKLVTVLGTLLLPACAYLGLRLLGSPFPGPALGAVSSLCFLFMEANSMWGGNIPSTLAGEFTFSLALALAVLFVGVLRWTMRHHRGRLRSGVLVALIGFAHGYALLWAGLVSLLELVTTRDWWRRLGTLIVIHGIAILLMGFWLFQLLWYTPWTTAFNPVWHIKSWQEILPPILWPAAGVAVLASLGTAAISWRRRQPFPRVLGALWGAVALSLFFYLAARSFHVVDIRFMPFFQLSLCLLAAAAAAQLVARLPAAWIWPLVAVLLVPPFVEGRVRFIPGWIEWNYSGFESKPAWPVFRDINRHLEGDYTDPRVAWEHSPAHGQFGTTRAFENLPLFSGRSTLEGVYMQAAVTAPFIFYLQSEISQVTSCPFPEWGCGRLDLERGREHLEMFNVSQLILRSPEAKAAAAASPDLALEASFGEYEVHRLVGADGSYAQALGSRPSLVKRGDWKQDAYRWFKRARRGDPVPVFAKRASAAEEASFAAVFEALPEALPDSPLAGMPKLVEEIGVDRITLTGCRPGHPVLIRVTYHPRWRAVSGERVWLAGPGFMLVFPRGERLELEFGEGPVLAVGRVASVLGLGILLLSLLPPGRRLGESLARAVGRAAGQTPLAGLLARIDRSARWPERRRRAVLRTGVGLVAVLLTAFAIANARPDADGTYRRAQLLFDDGRFAEAAELFRQAQELAPMSMTAIHSRYFEAISYYKLERWATAEQRFLALVESFPEAPNVAEDLWHVGLCRERMGDAEGAAAAWRRVVAEFPQSPWAGYARERLAAAAQP